MGGTMPDGLTGTVAVILLLLAPLLLLWFVRRLRSGTTYTFRKVAAFDALRGLLGTVAERGKRVHVSLGNTGIGGEHTAIVSAGMVVLRYLAERGASLGASPIVTVADPSGLLAAQDALYQAYAQTGQASSARLTDVRFVAPDAAAYAVGAQDIVDSPDVAANVMVGHFGDEYLLIGEAGAQREITQVVGSNALAAHPFMVATSEHVLLGEESFAAGAYLGDRPEHAASLLVQDVLRVIIVVAIIGGVLLTTLLGRAPVG